MIRIRCLECRERFLWDSNQGWPTHCPICQEFIGVDETKAVAAPMISYSSKRRPDMLYRDLEQKSEVRAQLAAEQLGVSVNEVSHLKTTDIKDGMREGDTAFIPVVNEVSKSMDQAPQHTGFSAGAAQLGIQASRGTNQGPFPRAGTNYIQNVLKPTHMRDAQNIRLAASRSDKG